MVFSRPTCDSARRHTRSRAPRTRSPRSSLRSKQGFPKLAFCNEPDAASRNWMLKFLHIRDKDFSGLSLELRAGHWLDCRRRMVCGSDERGELFYDLPFGGKPTMSNELPKMPHPAENDSFIPTLNQQGAIWLYVDEITRSLRHPRRARKWSLPMKSMPGNWRSLRHGRPLKMQTS